MKFNKYSAFVVGLLHLNKDKWQAIDKQSDVRPKLVTSVDARHLGHTGPVVSFWMLKVNKLYAAIG